MSAPAGTLLNCTTCRTTYRVKSYDPRRSYRCTSCSSVLVDSSKPAAPPPSTASSPAPASPDNLPDEVRQALAGHFLGFGQSLSDGRGRFVLLSPLGEGGMGMVSKAWDRKLNRFVAIKFLLVENRQDIAQRFEREARLAAGLSHPHIAAVFDFGESTTEEDRAKGVNRPYIVMQFVDGTTLDKTALRGAAEAARWMADAAHAIHYAHERGVVHRDIKPQNIMVDRQGHLFVMDFGLAKAPVTDAGGGHTLSVSSGLLGTPAFMSPEQALGQLDKVDARSDVYSLGATFYTVLAGRRPFEAGTLEEVLVKVVTDLPSPLRAIRPDIPSGLDRIVLKAMSRDKDERHESAAALADELERFMKNPDAPDPDATARPAAGPSICPSCRAPAPPGGRFCARCGGKISRACPGCGAELRAPTAFCPSCGVDLGKARTVRDQLDKAIVEYRRKKQFVTLLKTLDALGPSAPPAALEIRAEAGAAVKAAVGCFVEGERFRGARRLAEAKRAYDEAIAKCSDHFGAGKAVQDVGRQLEEYEAALARGREALRTGDYRTAHLEAARVLEAWSSPDARALMANAKRARERKHKGR